MSLGEYRETCYYNKPAPEAFDDVCLALKRVARVKETNRLRLTARAKTRYGLQAIDLKITIHPTVHGCQIEAAAFGDDIWGAGARSTIDNFLEALDRLEDPSYVPTKNPVSAIKVLLWIMVIVLAIIPFIDDLRPLVSSRHGWGAISGFGILAYFLIARSRFTRT